MYHVITNIKLPLRQREINLSHLALEILLYGRTASEFLGKIINSAVLDSCCSLRL
jgi:hypothetical protein